ncbi:thioesterase domain-containing protein [Actinosynnema sp. NPDC059335]|uniref:thioesterase domain-containing protein n=1 Tax=Actinosynnema sp. NPDC059335 TaxID=3346804 RepID=UPI00366E37F7
MTTIDPMPSVLAELARTEIKIRLVGHDELEISAPRGTMSPALRDRILAQKQAIVRWLSGAGPRGYVLPRVVPDPAAADEPFPLSDLQTSLLVELGDHVRPRQYMEFDLVDLDVERFFAAVNRNLLRQRDNLVVVTEDMRLRRVPEFTPLSPVVHDFRGLPAEQVERELLRIRENARRRQLPLDRWPWLDVRISLHGERDARVHYTNNSFFSDGMGTSRFLDNVFALHRDPEHAVPELEVGFRDCVLTLAAVESSPLGRESEQYWRDRIPDWPDAPAVPLTADRDRSELTRREWSLSADVWSALKRRARAHGLTAGNVVYAAFAEVVATWSGSRHFLLDNVVTHRLPLHPQIGEVMGNFASLYPLEVDWRAVEPFAVRARKLRAQVLQDMQNVHWSGAKVLQALNRHRRTPGRVACPFVIGGGVVAGKVARPAYSALETPQVLLDCRFREQGDGSAWITWDVAEPVFPDGAVDAVHAAFRRLVSTLADSDEAWRRTGFDLAVPTASTSPTGHGAASPVSPRGPVRVALPEQVPSVRAAAARCEEAWSPLVPLREVAGAPAVFLVHPAGGDVLAYRGLAALVDLTWYALRPPARDVPTEVADFAARYAEAIRTVRPHGPYVLGGWSSGAVIAAEVAHRLERDGEDVARLFVFDSPSPLPAPEADPVSLLLWFLEDLDPGFRADDATGAERAALLATADEDLVAAGLALVERRTGRAVAADEAHLRHTYDVFTAVVRACRRHRPSTIAADVHVIRAANGLVTAFADHPHASHCTWGWQALTTGRTTGTWVAGTHHTILTDRHVADVAAAVCEHTCPDLLKDWELGS